MIGAGAPGSEGRGWVFARGGKGLHGAGQAAHTHDHRLPGLATKSAVCPGTPAEQILRAPPFTCSWTCMHRAGFPRLRRIRGREVCRIAPASTPSPSPPGSPPNRSPPSPPPTCCFAAWLPSAKAPSTAKTIKDRMSRPMAAGKGPRWPGDWLPACGTRLPDLAVSPP